jgi:hypothetical protein
MNPVMEFPLSNNLKNKMEEIFWYFDSLVKFEKDIKY